MKNYSRYTMKRIVVPVLFFVFLVACSFYSYRESTVAGSEKQEVDTKWQPFKTVEEGGLLGERIDLWRNKRLWYVDSSNFLLSGFENRPGEHAWQGEHVGKWLHAATLDYAVTRDTKLEKALRRTVDRLLATQLPNGYMGTYKESERFYNAPADPAGWDTWTHRYNLYGLLTYEKYFPDERVVEACKRMGDLLIGVYGRGKADLTRYGTRQGISSTTLLESVVMLYERTKDKKYLDFAEHIVALSEQNPGLRLMGALLKEESVVGPGDGKAYQLMANLLGYLRLYQATNNEKYLQAVLKGWQQIKERHILVTGGPWTRKMAYNGNKECFAHQEAFHPEEVVVENCCTVTWIQLNLHLGELTGLAKYTTEAERSLFNHFLGGQHSDGIDWCYYTKPNQTKPPYVPTLHCCASSGPRALEMFSAHLAGEIDNHLSINHLSSATVSLGEQFGGGSLTIKNNFPLDQSAELVFDLDKAKGFIAEFRLPFGASLSRVAINGREIKAEKNAREFYEVRNKWKKGDVLTIAMDYHLNMHVQEGEAGKKWIAFTYGPVALAQRITDNKGKEPFKDLKVGLDQPDKILALLAKLRNDDENLVFTIKDAGIELVPYYQTGSRQSGPKTYFEYSY